MRRIIAAITLFLTFASPAAAAGGIIHNYDTRITYNQAITLPYEFEAYDITDAGAEQLDVEMWSADMINQIGSIALTLYSILSQLTIVGAFVVVLLALLIVFWLWRFVTSEPTTKSIDLFQGVDAGIDVYETVTGDQRQSQSFRRVSRSLKRGSRYIRFR